MPANFVSALFVMETLQTIDQAAGVGVEATPMLDITSLMESLPVSPPARRVFDDSPPTVHVQLLYEDGETRTRASEVFNRLAEDLKWETEFVVTFVPFDALGEPGPQGRVAAEVAEAKILLLSTHRLGELPVPVHAWLEQWLALNHGEPRALVLLLDPSIDRTVAAHQTLNSLRTAARLAGVDIFQPAGPMTASRWNLAVEDMHYRTEPKPAILEEASSRVEMPSHWGINE